MDCESIKVILQFPNDTIEEKEEKENNKKGKGIGEKKVTKKEKYVAFDWDNLVNECVITNIGWKGGDVFNVVIVKSEDRIIVTSRQKECLEYLFDIQKKRCSKGIYKRKMDLMITNGKEIRGVILPKQSILILPMQIL